MPLSEFIPERTDDRYSLAVVNRETPRPLQSILEDTFADQSVRVDERSLPDADDDLVLLLENGDVVASSTMTDLQETILLVNSDLYTTGTRDLEDVTVPAVIEHLDEVPFELRGYPEAHKEKLLLITISRYVERLAWATDGGTLRASFQRLSRIDDESGTRAVYERLAESGVDTHVYGVDDWLPPETLAVTTHAGHTPDFERGWFVVFAPPEEGEAAALVAYESATGRWDGFWTYRDPLVEEINRYIERTM